MPELPRIQPNSVSDYKGPSFNLFRYQSDSRVESRVSSSCDGANASFSVSYKALDNAELSQMICFFAEVRVDYATNISLESFKIPRNHPFWRNVSVFDALERCWLWANSIDEALWIIADASTISVPQCGFNDFSFRVEEVIDV